MLQGGGGAKGAEVRGLRLRVLGLRRVWGLGLGEPVPT